MTPFLAITGLTIRLALGGRGGGALVGLVFYLAVVTVVPFAIGPDLNLLARIGPAVLWIGALLASLLVVDRLFGDDAEDGSLDLLVLSDLPLELIVLAKAVGAWLATGLPLAIAAPFFGLLLGMDPAALAATTATLMVGTPALTLVGVLGAGLMTALGRGGVMIAVLVLPFTIPVLIFGVSAAASVDLVNAPFLPPFLLLAALSLIGLVVTPVAAAAALRGGMD